MELYYAVSSFLTFSGKEAKPGYCRFISPDLVEYLDIESINGTNLLGNYVPNYMFENLF